MAPRAGRARSEDGPTGAAIEAEIAAILDLA
jgi:hypothetical protein